MPRIYKDLPTTRYLTTNPLIIPSHSIKCLLPPAFRLPSTSPPPSHPFDQIPLALLAVLKITRIGISLHPSRTLICIPAIGFIRSRWKTPSTGSGCPVPPPSSHRVALVFARPSLTRRPILLRKPHTKYVALIFNIILTEYASFQAYKFLVLAPSFFLAAVSLFRCPHHQVFRSASLYILATKAQGR